MIRDKDGQGYVAGFLDCVATTPLETRGELREGPTLFDAPASRPVERQTDLALPGGDE